MPALDRALALEQVHDVAVVVGEDLDLDVARPLDQPLDVERAVAERRRRLAPRRLDRFRRVAPVRRHDAHALAAAAGRRLDQDRDSRSASTAAASAVVRLIARRLARHDRHAGALPSARARAIFDPIALDDVAGRADEDEPAASHAAANAGVLRQEAVAGMDRVRAGVRAAAMIASIDR